MKNRVCEQMHKAETDNLIFRVWITANQDFVVDSTELDNLGDLLDSFHGLAATNDNMVMVLSKIESLPNIAAAEVLDRNGNGLLLYPDWN